VAPPQSPSGYLRASPPACSPGGGAPPPPLVAVESLDPYDEGLARISHSLDASWLDLWPAIAFSPLANTSCIGGGAQNRWRANSLRHRRTIL